MTARKPAKAWTGEDTATMLELLALNWTDGRIARALGVVRLTVWRRRTALGFDRADHPRKEGRTLGRGDVPRRDPHPAREGSPSNGH